MANLIETKRLNYMNAYVKRYDDGSEILQSYSTDVVKKTSSGKYIRLWHAWSPSTMKQVKTWCGHYFRGLPYEDGTYEDLTPEYKRSGYNMAGLCVSREVAFWTGNRLSEIQRGFSDSSLNEVMFHYNTACDKELKIIYKKDEKALRLLAAIKICVLRKFDPKRETKALREESKYPDIAMAAKLYNYSFEKLWTVGGLHKEYPDWSATGAFDALTFS